MCYTPKFLWDAFEGGLLRTIVMGLNIGMCEQDEKEKKKDLLIEYLIRYKKVSVFIFYSFLSEECVQPLLFIGDHYLCLH